MSPSRGSAISGRVVGLAIDVHRELGPGLLESAYEECLCFELAKDGIAYFRQVPFPVVSKNVRLDCGYRIDIVVDNQLIIEVKSVDRFLAIRHAQMLTYLRLRGHAVGLLINFNAVKLKDGLRRFVL